MKAIVIDLACSVFAACQIPAVSGDGWTTAEQEYPGESGTASNGWVELSGVYKAPPGATRARIELYPLWAPNGNVQRSDVDFVRTAAPRSGWWS